MKNAENISNISVDKVRINWCAESFEGNKWGSPVSIMLHINHIYNLFYSMAVRQRKSQHQLPLTN
jgi:hypothetical protein